VLLSLAALGADGRGAFPHDAAPAPGGDPGSGHVVLVELFTSQGCSSCPPADRLISALAAERAGSVVTLEFHVDFWNSGGWTDPFSSKDWTVRQVAYERALGQSQPYTPQAVVDGHVEMVGSDAARLRPALDQAAARPGARIQLQLEPSAARVRVGADVTIPDALRERRFDLMAAVFERDLTTPVGRGENGGHTLHNDFVVRSLERVDKIAAGGPASSRHTATLHVSKDWDASRLGVAIFLQDPKSLEIVGAAAQPFPAASAAGR
jgi:hypothetical protein